MNIYTIAAKIYGMDGHRIKESFNKSKYYNWSERGIIRIVEVLNADTTGTNEYSIIRITRNTRAECYSELDGQLSDGIFENCRIGYIKMLHEDGAEALKVL